MVASRFSLGRFAVLAALDALTCNRQNAPDKMIQ